MVITSGVPFFRIFTVLLIFFFSFFFDKKDICNITDYFTFLFLRSLVRKIDFFLCMFYSLKYIKKVSGSVKSIFFDLHIQ